MRLTALAVFGMIFGGFLLVALMMVGWFFGSYNSAIQLRNTAKTQQAEIDSQLQRRSDLIPNLVASTKGSMKQEQKVFDDISKAQAAFSNATAGSQEKQDAGAAVGAALRGYLVVAQQYPNLKSLDIVKDLQVAMEGTENRITVARTRYNDAVQSYNTRIQSLPLSLFASSMGFQAMEQFKVAEDAKAVPKANFDDI